MQDVVVEESRARRILREDTEFERYGREVLKLRVVAGMVHSYRGRRARRMAAQFGWWLSRPDVIAWLSRYHVDPRHVVDVRNQTHVETRASYTDIACAEAYPNGVVHTWRVWVPEDFPMQGRTMPDVLD